MTETLTDKQAEARASIERDFADLEQAFRADQAGLADLLQVYGGYEASVQQAEQYLRILQPAPRFSVNDSTTTQSPPSRTWWRLCT